MQSLPINSIGASKAIATLLLATCAATPTTSIAQDATVDAIVDHFLGQLASRQGFTRLTTVSSDAAKVGSLYGVVSPDVTCVSDLRKQSKSGTPISVQYLDDIPRSNDAPKKIKDWTTVNIHSVLGAGAEASIAAKLPGKKAEVRAALDFLKSTQAQIIFGILEYPSIPLLRYGRKYLKDQDILAASDAGSEVNGVVIPHAQLLLQKFEFNQDDKKSAEAGLGASFSKIFSLNLNGQAHQMNSLRVSLPTNGVFAFKAEPLLFGTNCQPNK